MLVMSLWSLRLCCCYHLDRVKEGETALVPQVVQYEPAHTDAINCVVSLTSDLCASGGHDQVSWRSIE